MNPEISEEFNDNNESKSTCSGWTICGKLGEKVGWKKYHQ